MLQSLLQAIFGDFGAVGTAVMLIGMVGTLGLILGELSIKGVRLGIGGVLFSGILIGHFGGHVDGELAQFIREFGLMLFVYTIGIQVGPGFFQSLRKAGLPLNTVAVTAVTLSAAFAMMFALLFDMPVPAILGLFSGAVTNTPSLAAGQQILTELSAASPQAGLTGTAYAIAYPFGIIGTIIAILLLRVLFKINTTHEEKNFETERVAQNGTIEGVDLVIRNSSLAGTRLGDIAILQWAGVVVSRLRRNDDVIVPTPDTRLQTNDILHIVGPQDRLQGLIHTLGEQEQSALTLQTTDIQMEKMIVTNTKILGKAFGNDSFNVGTECVVTRINRAGIDFSATSGLPLQFGDVVTVVGPPPALEHAATILGNSSKTLNHPQILPILIGLILGVLLGSIAIPIPGMPAPIKLGLAGGPLLVAIILSRVGHMGKHVWFMPSAAMLALRELGIIMFLSVVGLKAGEKFFDTLLNGQGLVWFFMGVVITLVPLLMAACLGRLLFKINYFTLSGVLAGSMTDPPALAFATSRTKSEAPALGYATVYPLTMCLRIIVVQVMALLLWTGG